MKKNENVVIESVVSIDHDNPNGTEGTQKSNALSYKYSKENERKSEM